MNVCHCGQKFTYGKIVPYPRDWPSSDADEAWECGTCSKPSHAVSQGVTVLRGPKDARHLYSAEGLGDGISILHWQTNRGRMTTMEYKPYPRRPKMPEGTKQEPLLLQLWELLEDKMKMLDTTPEYPHDALTVRAQARGIAEALAILMYPFMENADAVVRAAVKRHKDPTFEVPGLGTHMFNPHFNHDGTPRVSVAQPKANRTAIKAPSTPPKVLSDTEKQTIRDMLASQMMKADELAKMFSVPLTTVLELSKS